MRPRRDARLPIPTFFPGFLVLFRQFERVDDAQTIDHGIGKLRKGFLPRGMSEATLDWNKQLKTAVDPGNIFGAGNQDINRKR